MLIFLGACGPKKQEPIVTPWGEIIDSVVTVADEDFDLSEIQGSGEMILLTLSGPEFYYDYRGKHLGTQYLLAQKFADSLGVRLRVEVCRDTTEMAAKLGNNEGDLMATTVPGQLEASLSKPLLTEELKKWCTPARLDEVRRQEAYLLSSRSVKRRVYSPMLDRKGGVISHYDHLFVQYAQTIRWDWRLMAAQCYQESTFDPKATSWAGAKGLMQIMPGTADHLGLARSQMYDPEPNIAAAAKYLGELEQSLSDISNRQERTYFVLASYNGGIHHIRDAMALCQRDGKNPQRWADVEGYVLKLAQPEFYNDPLVKYGYMRGSETTDYVAKIRERWQTYRQVRSPRHGFTQQPRKAKKTHKYKSANNETKT